jgi:hypothetical protein
MGSDRALSTRCMFNENGKCHFHESYETQCNLCFNFSEPGSSKKPVTGLLSYIDDLGLVGSIFPSGNTSQNTLKS